MTVRDRLERLSEDLTRDLLRLREKQRSLLALELFPLLAGLRAATLIDSVSLDARDARKLARFLDEANTFLTVFHESSLGQTFVVNRQLLEERASQEITFVEIGGANPRIFSEPPQSFSQLLSQVLSIDDNSQCRFKLLSLPDGDRPQDLIPLAGYLLEYLVAYNLGQHESREGKNCLGGNELILIEARLVDEEDSGAKYRLLSFSYPRSLISEKPSLETSVVVQQIKTLFNRRLETSGHDQIIGKNLRIEVESKVVVLDQVAL